MAKPLVLFGNGPIAKLVRWYFEHDTDREIAAFAVDAEFLDGDSFQGLPLVDFAQVETLYPPDKYDMFIAISYRNLNRDRAVKYKVAKEMGYFLPSYISPRCCYLSESPPGDNCLILENNTIQPFVEIGSNVTLWSGNHIGHDSRIGDHVYVASQAVISGNVTVMDYCFIGVNATLRNGITLAPSTIAGAGALIMKSTRENQVFVGVRGKPLSGNVTL